MENKDLTSVEFKKFQSLIYQMCGIRVSEKKRSLLSNRLRRRLRVGGYADFNSYLRHLENNASPEDITTFLDEITTNETSFFRTPKHFDWFSKTFIKELVKNSTKTAGKRQLRIWSAACSSGEEPYSIAMCLAENRLWLKEWELEIVATDLSQAMLDKASEGIFKQRSISGLDDRRRKKYFTERPDNTWQIKPSIRELVTFKRHNLMKPWRGLRFDCVFLRNVMIYFDQDSKQVVVDNLSQAIKKGGYLVVGPSEGIFDMLSAFQKQSTFLYQK